MSGSGIYDYDDLLRDELAAEDTRKASLEQRGLAVITTSGALVTLLFGLAVLSTSGKHPVHLSPVANGALGLALGFFVLAALAALFTNQPMDYKQASPKDIADLVNAGVMASPNEARKDVAGARIDELSAARAKNGMKATVLAWALRFETIAVLAVAVGVWDILSPF